MPAVIRPAWRRAGRSPPLNKLDKTQATLVILGIVAIYGAVTAFVVALGRMNLVQWSDVGAFAQALSAFSCMAVGVVIGLQVTGGPAS